MSGKYKEETKVSLRALEPEDIDILYSWENDPDIWEVSNTHLHFSKQILKQYIEHAQEDIFLQGQIRMVVCDSDKNAVGFIDLFDFDTFHQRAGVGILIHSDSRNKGYGKAALEEILKYSFIHLGLHQLFCNISEDNENSLKLFSNIGFKECGRKKEWIKSGNNFKDELIYQIFRKDFI